MLRPGHSSWVNFIWFLLAICVTPGLRAQEVLTNDAVVEMVKAGIGDDVIITEITDNPGNYSVGVRDIIALKEKHVSDKVIAAIQAKAKSGTGQSPDAEAKEVPGTARKRETTPNVSGRWEVSEPVDPMSGKKRLESFRVMPMPDGSGSMEVTGTCDANSVMFHFVYMARDKKTAFKQNWDGATYTPGGLLGAIVAAGRHSKPWVEMRVRIDDDPPVTVTSEFDYLNESSIFFFGDPLQIAARQGGTRPDVGAASLVGMFAAGQSAGRVEKAIQANSILVEFTLDNGQKEILKLEPQEATFRSFITKCASENPPPPAPGTANRPHLESAPGHHLSDTYAQTIEIMKRNAQNHVSDAFTSMPQMLNFIYHPCKGVTSTGADVASPQWHCEATSEPIRISGDLIVPAGFWEETGPTSYRRACETARTNPPGRHGWVIQVGIANQPDGARYFVSCQTIFALAGRRQEIARRTGMTQ